MSRPMTFLGLTVAGWVGIRLLTAGFYPGALAQASQLEQAAASPSLVVSAKARTVEAGALPILIPYPVYVARPSVTANPSDPSHPTVMSSIIAARAASAPTVAVATAQIPFAFQPQPRSTALPPTRPPASLPMASTPPAIPFDRWQLTSWAMFRDDVAGGSPPLASGGTLGGSQAGSRLTYRFNNHLAASARISGATGGTVDGGEAAIGIRYTPFANIPLSLTAERRQRLGETGGRNDFALFLEGGIWNQPLPLDLAANGYLQAGVVGVESQDMFVDGSFTLTRPLAFGVEGGIGVWGGAQPGLSRLDAGPRLSMPLTEGIRAHIDWRQRLTGNAAPDSGPVLSIGADF